MTRSLPTLPPETMQLTIAADGSVAGLFVSEAMRQALGGFAVMGEAPDFWDGFTAPVALSADLGTLRTTVLDAMRECHLCEYHCGTDRTAPLDRRSVCGVGTESRVAQVTVLGAEEAPISPAATVFFAGCALRCAHCHSSSFSWDAAQGSALTADAVVDRLLATGMPKTVQFVGGNPDHHLLFALDVIAALRVRCGAAMPPIVWNSALYVPEQVVAWLGQVVDVFLPDFKWWEDRCARIVGKVPSVVDRQARDKRYAVVLARNVAAISTRARLIVRHVPVPGHEACCTDPIRRWAARQPRLQGRGGMYHEPPFLSVTAR